VSDVETDRCRVFWNATRLALRDGQITNGEKRILVKMSHALKLKESEPKMVYDSVISGREPDTGEEIGEREMRLVYEQVLEAMLIHTDRSDDVLAQIAYLRKMFGITESEHRAIARSMDRQLEDIVHRPFIDEFRMRLKDSVDRMGDIFETVKTLTKKE
jgi:hypothetical protein|tara:strand:- start:18363 stop:18839 length:477 start_codon:yes stop_codon:yes gene_type:complete